MRLCVEELVEVAIKRKVQVPVEYMFRAARTPQAHIGHSTWSCPKMWGGGAPHPTGPPPHLQCESLSVIRHCATRIENIRRSRCHDWKSHYCDKIIIPRTRRAARAHT